MSVRLNPLPAVPAKGVEVRLSLSVVKLCGLNVSEAASGTSGRPHSGLGCRFDLRHPAYSFYSAASPRIVSESR
jgi:hypothetical protein